MLLTSGSRAVRCSTRFSGSARNGKALGRLQIRKAYSGGAGIGGAGFIDIQNLTTQVGEQAAQTLLDWSQGKDIATN